jgi:hypothetical protein
LLTWANQSADTDVQRSTDTSRIDIITFPPPLRRSPSDSAGTAAPHDRARRDNTASEERFKENMLAGPEARPDEPGRRSPRKRINAILAAASLLAGFALLAALFEPDRATQEFIILSVTATIGATIAFSCARNEQMAAVLTAALGVAAIVLGIMAVVRHLYPWLLQAEWSEWRHLLDANSDQFAISEFSSRHNVAWPADADIRGSYQFTHGTRHNIRRIVFTATTRAVDHSNMLVRPAARTGSQHTYTALRQNLATKVPSFQSPAERQCDFRDQAFTSPSAAAAIITGRQANGRVDWKIQRSGTSSGGWQDRGIDQVAGERSP